MLKSNLVKPKSFNEEFGSHCGDGDDKHLPTISISSDDLPSIKDWQNGTEYLIIQRVAQVSRRDEDGKTRSEFEIKEIGTIGAISEGDRDKNGNDNNPSGGSKTLNELYS